MTRFDIEPETVPAIAIILGKHRISFVPIGLWVIGGNGRVNITTNNNQYILIDSGGYDDEPSQWLIVNPLKRGQRVYLDKNIFSRLIMDEDIF